jgi:hypothetical protein
MKKQDQIRVRMSDADKAELLDACLSADLSMSAVVTDLMKAVIPYISRHCAAKRRWYPPRLVPEIPEGTSDQGATVVAAVINGHRNHVHTSVKGHRKGVRRK